MTINPNFVFVPQGSIGGDHFPFPWVPNPLGPLLGLVGNWNGTGFNTIWRPNAGSEFLELDLTADSIQFDVIPGQIPNRGGIGQPDIFMFGLRYLQQVQKLEDMSGLHLEPGIWAVVPATAEPAEPPTVVRMGSIPHGTVFLAQGTATYIDGPPTIPDVNIIPFQIDPPLPVPSFEEAETLLFGELDMSVFSASRIPADGTPPPGPNPPPYVSQAMVENPNIVLRGAIAHQEIVSTVILHVSTILQPPGGGTANTDFVGRNANSTQVECTFWLETVVDPLGGPDFLQLQYSQTVMLDFRSKRWPHVTVGTLTKRTPVIVPLTVVDPFIPEHLIRHGFVGPNPNPILKS